MFSLHSRGGACSLPAKDILWIIQSPLVSAEHPAWQCRVLNFVPVQVVVSTLQQALENPTEFNGQQLPVEATMHKLIETGDSFAKSAVTIHSVITDRIDRLRPNQQLTLKVVSHTSVPAAGRKLHSVHRVTHCIAPAAEHCTALPVHVCSQGCCRSAAGLPRRGLVLAHQLHPPGPLPGMAAIASAAPPAPLPQGVHSCGSAVLPDHQPLRQVARMMGGQPTAPCLGCECLVSQ